jgi:hypothetical protein
MAAAGKPAFYEKEFLVQVAGKEEHIARPAFAVHS